jgi:hypothetical protein
MRSIRGRKAFTMIELIITEVMPCILLHSI